MAYLELLQNDMKKNDVEFFVITGLRKSVLKTERLYEELMQWDQGNRNGISSRSHLSSKLILNNFNLRSGYFNVDFRFVHLVRPQNFPKN